VIVQTILFTLFGDQYDARVQKQLLVLIRELLVMEFTNAQDMVCDFHSIFIHLPSKKKKMKQSRALARSLKNTRVACCREVSCEPIQR
jgi:allophanate hydrolase subunit 1